jgi:glycosyltransferase involved in cell wall biosynthesis
MLENKSVSVVVPSFNRAHLLEMTLPSYLQENVTELILIDDCSTDNTEKIVKKLQKKHPEIKYIKNMVNSKQPYSKNVGVDNARNEYIYFGDDDSYITEHTISILMDILEKYNADGAGARFLNPGGFVKLNEMNYFIEWKNKQYAHSSKEICDLENMKINFGLNFRNPIEVPVLHASALIKTNVVKAIRFDTNFLNCAYREETDLFIRATLAGYKLIYQPLAVQINLPLSFVKNSGAHYGGQWKWSKGAVECNKYFLDKNWDVVSKWYHFKTSKEKLQKRFTRMIFFKNTLFWNGLKRLFFVLFGIDRSKK